MSISSGNKTALIGEWELYKVEDMGEILEEGDPGWKDQSIIITSNKLIFTSDGVEESANYTCNNGQIITEYEYEGEIVKVSTSYSIESKNILILNTELEGISNKQFFRKL